MNQKTAERYALASLIALATYCLACMYPVGWSPDSKKMVFPVFGKDGVERLVTTDLSGRALHEVASGAAGKTTLSVASWSPDGKWIAYLEFETRRLDKPGVRHALACSLMLQNTATGRGAGIVEFAAIEDGADNWPSQQANMARGPQWLADSKRLAFYRLFEKKPALVVVGLDGKETARVALPKECSKMLHSASVSPQGDKVTYVAAAKGGKKEDVGLRLYDMRTGKTSELKALGAQDKDGPSATPVWSGDGRYVFTAVGPKAKDAEKGAGRVERIEVKTGKVKKVWEKQKARVFGLSLAPAAGRLAVDYLCDVKGGDDYLGIDVVDLTTGRATPAHFMTEGTLHYSTSLSPDGKWLAFCPLGGKEGKDELNIGAILSADGARIRFFVPEEKRRKLVGVVLDGRAAGALAAIGLEGRLKKAGLDPAEIGGPGGLEKVKAEVTRIAAGQTAPVVRQGLAWVKVRLHFHLLDETPAPGRAALAGAARKEVESFVKAHPEHPLGPHLRKQLADLLAGGKLKND